METLYYLNEIDGIKRYQSKKYKGSMFADFVIKEGRLLQFKKSANTYKFVPTKKKYKLKN